jgi:hypothetical protein
VVVKVVVQVVEEGLVRWRWINLISWLRLWIGRLFSEVGGLGLQDRCVVGLRCCVDVGVGIVMGSEDAAPSVLFDEQCG